MPMDRRMDKQEWYIHRMEYYATLKRKEILTHATIWMNPEDLKLNEVSQPQKANAR